MSMSNSPQETLEEIRERRHRLRHCVQPPAIGTCLPWSQPSLFNSDSLIATIIDNDPNARRPPQAASQEDINRPDKRVPLPILCKSAAQDGSAACGPRPGQSLRLDKLLGQSYDTPTLVYKCTVLPEAHTVVVKMLTDQNDKLPAGTYIPEEVYANQRDWMLPGMGVTANMDICNEADRFKDLQSLQGIFVPYSYGLYEFLLPDGYSVLAHVMEYVPTIDIRRYFVEACIPDAIALNIFLSALHRAYVELHRCGVVHLDAAIRNLCIIPTNERRLQVVILDFTLADSIPGSLARGLEWVDGERAFLNQLYDELEFDTVMEWLETTRNGKAYYDMCAMSPDELAIHDPLPLPT